MRCLVWNGSETDTRLFTLKTEFLWLSKIVAVQNFFSLYEQKKFYEISLVFLSNFWEHLVISQKAEPFPVEWFLGLFEGFFANSHLDTRWWVMVQEDTTIVTWTVMILTRKRNAVMWMRNMILIAAFAGTIKHNFFVWFDWKIGQTSTFWARTVVELYTFFP